MSEHDYRSLYDSCKFREAINDCDTVLRFNPANEDALWLKGMCWRELKQFERAIECFNKLLEVNPSRAGAALYAAVLEKCLQSKSAWNESIEVYAAGKLVSLPQGASAMFANDYNEMGLYLNNQGRFRDALQWYDMALDARPRHAMAWFNKGVALARMGNFNEAIVCFDKALEIEPKYVDALYSKAGCAVELGQYALALDSYDKVIALNPNDIEAKQCRSQTLKRVNDTNLS